MYTAALRHRSFATRLGRMLLLSMAIVLTFTMLPATTLRASGVGGVRFGLGGAAQLADPIVRYVALGGNDAGNDCLVDTSPCRTIGAAILQATDGDTIDIDAGTYPEHLTIDKSLTLSGAGKAATIIDGNNAGIVVTVSSTVSVNISGVTIQHGQNSNGGGISNTGGTVTLTNSAVAHNTATGLAGGGIYNSGGTLTLTGSDIISNTVVGHIDIASGGGGIYSSGGTVALLNSIVRDNTTGDGLGGGIHIVTSTLTMTESTITGNSSARSDGGGIFAYTSTLTLNTSTISHNTAFFGGGIEVYHSSSLRLSDSSVMHNTVASTGGGIANTSGVLIVSDSTISDNVANGIGSGGGGIWSAGDSTLIRSTISGNHAPQGIGGGIYNTEGAYKLMLDASTVSNNTAGSFGGGIYSTGGTLTIRDSAILGNRVQQSSGGGLYNAIGGQATITSSTIAGNQAAQTGGGIYNLGNMTIAGSTIRSNTATNSLNTHGGGIANFGTLELEGSDVSENIASAPTVGGGGIFNVGTLNVDSSRIVTNTITGSLAEGGGIANHGTLTLRKSWINGNNVAGNYTNSIFGGGISNNTAGASLALIDSTVSNNTALNSGTPSTSPKPPITAGGGISSFGMTATLALTGSQVFGNAVSGVDYVWGGGIIAFGPTTLTNTIVSTNHVSVTVLNTDQLTVTAGGSGGGIFGYYGSHIDLNRSSVVSNTVSAVSLADGGGIAVLSGRMKLIDSRVSHNRVEATGVPHSIALGGGMNINQGVFTIVDSQIEDNHSSGASGGIHSGGTISITTSTIAGNSADDDAGGMGSYGTAILSGTQVLNNIAGLQSGGLSNGGTLTLIGSTVSGNRAGGVGGGMFVGAHATIHITDGSILSNISGAQGGGVYIANNAIATLAQVTIGDNQSASEAGGIYIGASTVPTATTSISHALIQHNRAGGYGGGIESWGKLTIADSQIMTNTTPSAGGGIDNLGVLTVTNSLIRANRLENPLGDGISDGAREWGGGIWSRLGSTLVVSGTTISDHHIGGDPHFSDGGGIALAGDMTAALTNVTISDNEVLGSGGGIWAGSGTTLTIEGSTISRNSLKDVGPAGCPLRNCNEGAGITGGSTITITNSTISENHSDNIAGGIFWQSSVNALLDHVTVVSNTARLGGGIWRNGAEPVVRIRNSIVANNTSLDPAFLFNSDCEGSPTSEGGNLFGITGECNPTGADLAGTEADPLDPQLGPLQNNGGSTLTHRVLPRSPALDAAGTACPPTDQRGVARPQDGDGDGIAVCDIGAFEARFDISDSGVRFPDDIPSLQNPAGAIDEHDYREVFGEPTMTHVEAGTDTGTISATDRFDLPFSLTEEDVVATLPISIELAPDGSSIIMPSLLPLMYETTVVTATFADANLDRANGALKAGLCVGLTSMTANFWAGADPTEYGGPTVNAIPPSDNVRSLLQRNHMRQLSAEVLKHLADQGRHDDVKQYFDDLASRIGPGWKADSEIIGIVNREGEPDQTCADAEVGHALWPYQVVRSADPPLYRIYVYDPNYPAVPSGAADDRYIEIVQDKDGAAWKWRYEITRGARGQPGVTWSGSTLYGLPIDVLLTKSTLPTEDDYGVLLVSGGQDNAFGGRSGAWGGRSGAWGELANGQQIGCVPSGDSVFFRHTISRSLRIFSLSDPALYVPAEEIRASGEITFHSRGGEVSDMLIFGEDTVIGYLGTVGDQVNTEDALTVDAALEAATLRTNETQGGKQITIYQMHEGPPGADGVSETRVVAVSNTNVGAGEALEVTVIKDEQGNVTGMTVVNSSDEVKTADIGFASAGGKGYSTVVFPGRPIEPGAQYSFTPSSWTDLEHAPVQVAIDTDRDGDPDRFEELRPAPAPSARVLDSFSRPDGPLGPAWAGEAALKDYRVAEQRAQARAGGTVYWRAQPFGATQEAFVTLSQIAPGDSRASLLLKVQGDNPSVRKGAIEVRYYAKHHQVRIMAREPNRPWRIVAILPATFIEGDRFSARALANGRVQVYRNDLLLGETSAGSYFANRGGRIGLRYLDARGAEFDDFGGGTAQ